MDDIAKFGKRRRGNRRVVAYCGGQLSFSPVETTRRQNLTPTPSGRNAQGVDEKL